MRQSSLASWLVLLFLTFAAASIIDSSTIVRVPEGQSEAEVIQAVRSEVSKAALSPRGTKKSSTTLDRSWTDAHLLQLGSSGTLSGKISDTTFNGGVAIVCTNCYIKGTAAAELTYPDSFNVSQTLGNITDQAETNIKNLTDEAEHYLHDLLVDIGKSVFEDEAFEYPTWNFSLEVDIPPVSETKLQFSFDGLEIYMEVDTIVSAGATYTIHMFNSARDLPEGMIGLYLTEKLNLGLALTVDLIFSVSGEIDVSSGFHLLLDDGFAVDIELFGNDVSDITYNGGHFEFLPVKLESAGVVFSAVLRVGMHAGFDLGVPKSPNVTIFGLTVPSFGGGIDVGVFANVAEFTTNITEQPDNQSCELGVAQSFQFALGASAGASIFVKDATWGPIATTSTPIWQTELATTCIKAAARTTPAAIEATSAVQRRQGMSVATTTSEITYTGVNCLSTGLINCPISLQNTSQFTTTTTLTATVTPGADQDDIDWQSTVRNSVTTTVPFGNSVVKVVSTSGKPVSYVPPPPTDTSISGRIDGVLDGNVNGTPNRLIIGLSVGLGVPFLIGILVGAILCTKKRAQNKKMVSEKDLSNGNYTSSKGFSVKH